MHRIFVKQLAKATKPSGEVDLERLGALVSAVLDESDRDRRRTDRSISLMIEELDRLNRGLEKTIAERTAMLHQREAELRAQNQRFDAAINNMAQGLCMFDADQRLVVCNEQYARMYGLNPDQVKPGTTLRCILQSRVEAGNCPDDADSYVRQRLEEVERCQPMQMTNRLRDGRVVAVVHQPLAAGGWVALHHDVTEQKRAEERIAHMAHHDALTALPNRTLLRKQLGRHLRDAERGGSLAVLCLDLDHFKEVNDSFGHPVGDALLCAVARRLAETVRGSDTVARLGGDEFAVIQVGEQQPAAAARLAQRIVDEMARPFDMEGREIVIGASIGIAVAPGDGKDADDLLKNADMALYRTKENGRSGFGFFESRMDAELRERHGLGTDLRKALAAGEFELFYQPLLDLERNAVCAFEALLRWEHPTRGMIGPATFIPLAEETGLIVRLGEWVLRQACAEAAKWPDDIRVAVNLSPLQFRSRALVPTVMSAMTSAGIPASRLELEVTESALLQNTEATVAALHQLREIGVRISLDDFGTGYSSLSYLRSFPFDKIKIDRSFIRDIETDKDAIAIIRAALDLGRSLGMATTVEGVETEKQLAFVRAEGCSEAQGYLIGRPQPVAEAMRLLATFGRNGRTAA